MGRTQARQDTALLVVSPGPQQGLRVPLPAGSSVVGRGADCDIRLDDPTVSRRHAKLVRDEDVVLVVDLGSTCGTSVAGRVVTDVAVLQPGDEVSFAAVTLRLTAPDRRPVPRAAPQPRASYDIGSQHADTISNVGNDQYVSYTQHVVQQRESFLAHVAATRTRARWLLWGGLLLLVVGTAVGLQFFIAYFSAIYGSVSEAFASAGSAGPPELELPRSGGAAVAVAIVLTSLGQLMVVVGIVLHVVASARARRVDRELPVPPPGAPGWPRH